VFITNTSDATKVRYYTPSFGGFSAGVSFTPTQNRIGSGSNNGQNIARKNGATAMQGQNVVEGGLVYDGEFGGVGVKASVVGLYGELVNGGEDDFGDDKWQGTQAGAVVDLFGFKLAGSYGYNEVGEQTNQFITAGIGAALGPVNTSVTYARLIDTNSDYEEATGFGDSAQNLVFSADIALAPGLVLAGDVAVFDQDQAGDDTDTGDQGWAAVGRFAVAF
jgi:outer membrane protein OmpU